MWASVQKGSMQRGLHGGSAQMGVCLRSKGLKPTKSQRWDSRQVRHTRGTELLLPWVLLHSAQPLELEMSASPGPKTRMGTGGAEHCSEH